MLKLWAISKYRITGNCFVDEIVNFTVDYWKDQILHTINLDGNPQTLLKPQGIMALRLADYIQVGGKKRLKQSRPKPEHILLGIPDSDMKTFNRVKLKNRPLYRGGRLYMIDHSDMLFGRLVEVYRSKIEIS